MKKVLSIVIAILGVNFVSAQADHRVKPTDNNVKIPNQDIIRLASQRPRDGRQPAIPDTARINAKYRVNPDLNAHRVNENSNAVQVDVSSQAKGTVASPIGSEPTKSNTTRTPAVRKPY